MKLFYSLLVMLLQLESKFIYIGIQEFRKDYTGDGSVNIKGLPILKHETGNWKACSFILGSD